MYKKIICATCIVLGYVTAQAQHTEYDFALRTIDSLSFVHADVSDLSFPDNHANETVLYGKLTNMLKTGKGRVNILHIGGSHVQAGVLSNQIRMNLATAQDRSTGKRWGGADRGLIFPFSAMKTDAPGDYQITYTGTWKRSRCISQSLDADLGLAGAAVMTTDPKSTLSVNLKNKAWSFKQLRVLGEATSDDVYPVVVVDGDTLQPAKPADGIGYLFTMPKETITCTIAFRGLKASAKAGVSEPKFTLRGMLPMSDRSGITYTASGINGAAVPSWLKCVHFQKELSLLPPDLVIFGIGINDACKSESEFSPEKFKANYRKLISRIQAVNPKCTFIFITNNDSYYNKRLNPNTPRAEQAFIELAREYNGGVFNVYRIMGGWASSEQWVKNGYMWGDHVHFRSNGYKLLGDLLSNAIINDFSLYNGRTK